MWECGNEGSVCTQVPDEDRSLSRYSKEQSEDWARRFFATGEHYCHDSTVRSTDPHIIQYKAETENCPSSVHAVVILALQ